MGFFKGFVFWLFIGIIFVGVFPYTGLYNVSALSGGDVFTDWFFSTTREHSIESRADKIVPPPLDSSVMIQRGAKAYLKLCEHCHSAPGKQETDLARGLNPEPPRLAEAEKEVDAAESFWVVKHGIKMTGMPSWGDTHSDKELWNIVAFLRKLPGLSPEEYQRLTVANGQSEVAGSHPH